jgi:uncharacterized protein (TIGR02453 family)
MKDILEFLSDLKANNNREWFYENRDRYQLTKIKFEDYVSRIIGEISLFDPQVGLPAAKDTIFRIFRDVRFSKDKLPYKTNFGAFIANGGRKSPKAGYYFHLEPGASMIGGGIYMPQPEVLKKIRQEIYFNAGDFRKLLEENKFKRIFGGLGDYDKLKRPPKDYDASFPDIQLLMYKSYVVMHKLEDEVFLKEGFAKEITEACRTMTDFNHFLNRAFEN